MLTPFGILGARVNGNVRKLEAVFTQILIYIRLTSEGKNGLKRGKYIVLKGLQYIYLIGKQLILEFIFLLAYTLLRIL